MYLNLTQGKDLINSSRDYKVVTPDEVFYKVILLLDTGLKEKEMRILSAMMTAPEKVWNTKKEDMEELLRYVPYRNYVYDSKDGLVEKGIVEEDKENKEFWLNDKWKSFATILLKNKRIEIGLCFELFGNENK